MLFTALFESCIAVRCVELSCIVLWCVVDSGPVRRRSTCWTRPVRAAYVLLHSILVMLLCAAFAGVLLASFLRFFERSAPMMSHAGHIRSDFACLMFFWFVCSRLLLCVLWCGSAVMMMKCFRCLRGCTRTQPTALGLIATARFGRKTRSNARETTYALRHFLALLLLLC
jgi:hypothetical protein